MNIASGNSKRLYSYAMYWTAASYWTALIALVAILGLKATVKKI